ncbi:sensor histidine kinase [Pedobacter metabolipauper]|uniref:histidine kinase n=1 Tax=Pedobacter metabolipauper TaxID=425513 RepID=A0A4R6SYS9_9SPHI|nr:MASE3 domain-containing protein [Pedobacter metabolipauper]TDQ11202.1 phospho-acceptor domain-containing protein [Pedobacter metabolipauper]
MSKLSLLFRNNYRTAFAVIFLVLVFYFSKIQGYILFHTFVELFSIVVAFAVFIVTWNSRRMQDNTFLHLVGISYIFIGGLDLLHTITYKGMNVISVPGFPANQFWVATRALEALTLLAGLLIIKSVKKLNSDLIFLGYFLVSLLIILSILVWQNFPVCFIEGQGQTDFKIYAEYAIIAVLLTAGFLLIKNKQRFSLPVYQLLLTSVIFTILSEFCFAIYISNSGPVNEIGHYAKLISFFLIYKANVETGFIRPTDTIFKNLKDSEEKYRTLAENLPGLVFRFDQDLNCIYSNGPDQDAMQFSTGNEAAADRPQTLSDQLRPILSRARQTGVIQQGTFDVDMPVGKQFYSVQVIPEYASLEEGGSYLVICQDVSGLKQTEQQLQALNETKDKLFSIIAHDLKNPFASLLSYSELIHKKAETLERVKIAHMAERMNTSAKQAYALLENLLNWSRIQTGLLKPSPEVISIAELFIEIASLTAPMALSKGVILQLAEGKDLTITADRQMTSTVLRNLISNALKFSYQGSSVKIDAQEKEGFVLFSVEDTGIGIAPENQDNLLEVGNKFSSPGTAAEMGTGLGLVLCREFVEANGGRIFLQSEFGVGTTFYFTLPRS